MSHRVYNIDFNHEGHEDNEGKSILGCLYEVESNVFKFFMLFMVKNIHGY